MDNSDSTELTKKARLVIGVIVGLLVFIVVFGIVRELVVKPRLEIYNMGQSELKLSGRVFDSLKNYLWSGLQSNIWFDEDKTGVRVLIRPSSISIVENEETKDYDFLIDVDEYKATYRILFTIYKERGIEELDDSPLMICPKKELMKYPETECDDTEMEIDEDGIEAYLPETFDLNTGEYVIVTSVEDEEDALEVTVSSCGEDETIIERTHAKVIEWIQSLGLDEDEYSINILEKCDGEAS